MLTRQLSSYIKKHLPSQKYHKHLKSSHKIHYCFGTLNPELDSKQKIQLLRKQPWFQQYQTATRYSAQQNYLDALRHYYKVVQAMEQKNQKGQPYYYRIFDKVLKINVILNRPLETEENLYKLIKVKKALQKNPILVYEDYQNLMIHQLSHNVQKAIKLGKALLSQSQINSLPINNEKYIRMLLGNAYLLVDNYPDAKKKYGEVLEMKPNNFLRGKTLNNLSIACWWHKNPMFPVPQQEGVPYEQLRINRDFRQTKQLFMNSIGSLENIEEMSENQAIALQSLLNEHSESIMALSSKSAKDNQVYTIQQKEVIQPIYNLIQYYIYNDPIQKPLIMAWMRILLKTASRFQAIHLVDEITAKYYLLNGEIGELTKLLTSVQARYEQPSQPNKKQSLTNPLLQRVTFLQLNKMMMMVNKITQAAQFKTDQNKIKRQQKDLLQKDPFIFKRQFLMSEELSFMKKGNQ